MLVHIHEQQHITESIFNHKQANVLPGKGVILSSRTSAAWNGNVTKSDLWKQSSNIRLNSFQNNYRQIIKANVSHLTWSAWGWCCSQCHNLHYLHIWYEPCQTPRHTGWPGLSASHFLLPELHRPPPLTETNRK